MRPRLCVSKSTHPQHDDRSGGVRHIGEILPQVLAQHVIGRHLHGSPRPTEATESVRIVPQPLAWAG